VLFDDGADVVAGIKANHDDVVWSNANPDYGEHGRTDDARSRHRAALLEHDRVEDGVPALDGERQDQAGGQVGEQVAEVLLQNAEELAAVDEVERRVREVPAPSGGQQAAEDDADEVERVGDGEREEVDVGRQLTHLGRREDHHAESVADQAGRDEEHRRADEDAYRRHHSFVVARDGVARRVEWTGLVPETLVVTQAAVLHLLCKLPAASETKFRQLHAHQITRRFAHDVAL